MKEIIRSHNASAIQIYEETGGPILLETRGVNKAYAPLDIAIPTAALEVRANQKGFSIHPISKVGQVLMPKFSKLGGKREGENLCIKTSQPSKGIREVLNALPFNHPLMGLYGAFAYDLVRETMDIGSRFWRWQSISTPYTQ